jgi:hypothetical protein
MAVITENLVCMPTPSAAGTDRGNLEQPPPRRTTGNAPTMRSATCCFLVQDRLHICEPEFAICHHARRRLVRSTGEDLQK